MELLSFQQTDGKWVYVNPSQIAVIQDAHNGSTYMSVGGVDLSLKSSIDEVKRIVNESLAKVS